MLPREGYQLERQANYAVALQLDLDEELLREGTAREVVHAVQNARKGPGLQVEDRIDLALARRRARCSTRCASTPTTWRARRSPRTSASTARRRRGRTPRRARIDGSELGDRPAPRGRPRAARARRVELGGGSGLGALG